MSVSNLERLRATAQLDPILEIENHLAFIERLREPVTFELLVDLLEKSFFANERFAPKFKSRLVFVYLKHNPELKREINLIIGENQTLLDSLKKSIPTFKRYIRKLLPYIVAPIYEDSVFQKYEVELDQFVLELQNYFNRIPQVI